MRGFIILLSFATAIFAGFTVWVDPTVGPIVRSYLPEGAINMPSIAKNSSGGSGTSADGTYGGVGAASRVTGAVLGASGN